MFTTDILMVSFLGLPDPLLLIEVSYLGRPSHAAAAEDNPSLEIHGIRNHREQTLGL